MKITETVNYSTIKDVVGTFPGAIQKVIEDPLLNVVPENMTQCGKASSPRVMAGFLLLTITAMITHLLTILSRGHIVGLPGYLAMAVLGGVVLIPVLIALGAFISFIIALILGFKGEFKSFMEILLHELPLFCVSLIAMALTSSIGFFGAFFLPQLFRLALSLLLAFRIWILCRIPRERILIALGVMATMGALSLLGAMSIQQRVTGLQRAQLFQIQEQSREMEQMLSVARERLPH